MLPVAIGSALLGFIVGRISKADRARAAASEAKSPITGVDASGWEDFVSKMVVADKGHVGRKGKLGAFQMDARRLADVGAMTKAWKGKRLAVVDGKSIAEDGAWVGEWASGLTEEKFLGSMPLQYATFVRSMRSAASKASGLVGATVGSKVATLSGLLGVAHVAGDVGVVSFVRDPKIRTRFPSTAGLFERTNEIF